RVDRRANLGSVLQQLTFQSACKPVPVSLRGPAALTNQEVVDRSRAECPDDVPGVLDGQIGVQGPALRKLGSESSQSMQPPCLESLQYVPQFRVAVGGANKHSIQRTRPAMDSRLSGRIELELSTWISLLNDSSNGRARRWRSLSAFCA